jgi:hypothetical protein
MTQPSQQVIKQHVIRCESHRLGQGGVQPGPGRQPPVLVGTTETAPDRLVQPCSDVGIAGGPAGQQGIEVFQGAGTFTHWLGPACVRRSHTNLTATEPPLFRSQVSTVQIGSVVAG